jgi:hypothetical protein
MTDNGCRPVNEDFLLWLQHFEKNRSTGKYFLLLDGQESHSRNRTVNVLDFDEKKKADCPHGLQALDTTSFIAQIRTTLLS